jgi:hypothetical protein
MGFVLFDFDTCLRKEKCLKGFQFEPKKIYPAVSPVTKTDGTAI